MALPLLYALGLLAGFVGTLIACAMFALVLWQAPHNRANQWIAVYFIAIVMWGVGAFVLRVQGLLGMPIRTMLHLAGTGAQLTNLSLFAILCHYTGLFSRWYARVLGFLGAFVVALNTFFYVSDQAVNVSYIRPDGTLIYTTSSSGHMTLVLLAIFGVVNTTLAIYYRKSMARQLVPGTLCCTLGSFIVVIPGLRSIPLPVLFAAASAILFTRVILSKQLFDPVTAAKRKAERASAAKTMFLARMGHELRTPLSTILGYCELVIESLDEGSTANAEQDLGKVIAASKHLLALVEEVLDITKIEEGKLQLVPTSFELLPFLENLRSIMMPLAAKNQNAFSIVDHAPDPGYTLFHDATRVRQILVNLLGNSAKFTINGKIILEVEPTRDGVAFRVIDTGIGMSAEQQTRVFNEFEQASSEVTRKHGGAGLGLSISRKLTEMMGGSLSCKSEIGKGSVFELHLPKEIKSSAHHLKD